MSQTTCADCRRQTSKLTTVRNKAGDEITVGDCCSNKPEYNPPSWEAGLNSEPIATAAWKEKICHDTQQIINTKQCKFGRVDLLTCGHTGDTTGMYTRTSDGCQMEIVPGRTLEIMKVAADQFSGAPTQKQMDGFMPSTLSDHFSALDDGALCIQRIGESYQLGYKPVGKSFVLYDMRKIQRMSEFIQAKYDLIQWAEKEGYYKTAKQ
ncbi:MAG: hypothetical protein K0U41_03540 [Gammaproteobacteria bacterium]|nr:hypothetical protein [Gammaproteobacteria bacterium]